MPNGITIVPSKCPNLKICIMANDNTRTNVKGLKTFMKNLMTTHDA